MRDYTETDGTMAGDGGVTPHADANDHDGRRSGTELSTYHSVHVIMKLRHESALHLVVSLHRAVFRGVAVADFRPEADRPLGLVLRLRSQNRLLRAKGRPLQADGNSRA